MKKHVTKANILLYLENIWYGMLMAGFTLYLAHKDWLEPYPTPTFLFVIVLIWAVIGTMDDLNKKEKAEKEPKR